MGGVYRVTRRFEFDAAHRLFGYDGPCARIHGHRYVAEVSVEGEELDQLGMLVDFGWLKKLVEDEVVYVWDHRLLLKDEDPLKFGGEERRLKENPTAEYMAAIIWSTVKFRLPAKGIRLANVRLYETPDCWVDYHE